MCCSGVKMGWGWLGIAMAMYLLIARCEWTANLNTCRCPIQHKGWRNVLCRCNVVFHCVMSSLAVFKLLCVIWISIRLDDLWMTQLLPDRIGCYAQAGMGEGRQYSWVPAIHDVLLVLLCAYNPGRRKHLIYARPAGRAGGFTQERRRIENGGC